MGRPLAPPPAPPAAPEPQSRNARLRDSAIGFLSIFALFVVLRIALPEIPNSLFVAASGALGTFFAVDIAVIRREENARDRALREGNENEREVDMAAEVAPELVNIAPEEPAPHAARGIRRRNSSTSTSTSISSSSTDQYR
jgi:hypothetical protein